MDLLLEIENVIEKNGSDFELSKLFKRHIKEYKESLPELFESSQGKDFLVKHTKKLDSIMSLMYKTILRRLFDPGDSNISQVNRYLPQRQSNLDKYSIIKVYFLYLNIKRTYVKFEYDEKKSQINKEKHNIDFVEAQKLWQDERGTCNSCKYC